MSLQLVLARCLWAVVRYLRRKRSGRLLGWHWVMPDRCHFLLTRKHCSWKLWELNWIWFWWMISS